MKNVYGIILGVAVLACIGGGVLIYKKFQGPADPSAAQSASVEPASGGAEGGPAAGESKIAWKVRCQPDEKGQRSDKCEVYQRISVKETGQRFAEFAIGFPKDEKQARGVVVLPLGVLLEPGVEMQIDEDQTFRFDIRYCRDDGCYAFVSFNDAIVNKIKTGKTTSFKFKDVSGQDIKLIMQLEGFNKALGVIG